MAVDDLAGIDLAELIQRRPGEDRITTAVVDDITPDGVPLVILAGGSRRVDASSLMRFPSAAAASEALLGRTVLILQNHPGQVVILGVVSRTLWDTREPDSASEMQAKLPAGEARAVQVDKRRLDLEASDEIRLTCGKSSMVLRRDGTVIVRGVTIVTRATQSNKIRGATVSIN